MWKIPDSPRITVADFFEAGRRLLQLDWAANAEHAQGREISEVALNRPGLALAGFLGTTPTAGFRCWAWRR